MRSLLLTLGIALFGCTAPTAPNGTSNEDTKADRDTLLFIAEGPFEDGWSADAFRNDPCLGPVAKGQVESFAWAIDRPGYYLVPEGKEPSIFYVAP